MFGLQLQALCDKTLQMYDSTGLHGCCLCEQLGSSASEAGS